MHYRQLNGRDALPFVEAVGRLRIAVFREFPYLYEGDLANERGYLETYFRCPRSLVVLAVDGESVVGASTALPLEDAEPEWQAPFAARGIARAGVMYFGESVLAPEHRGRGVGHVFFDHREAYAASLPGIERTAFCAVRRDAGDRRRPAAYRPHDVFWGKRGYVKVAGLTTSFSWKDVGDAEATPHPMDFWQRPLR